MNRIVPDQPAPRSYEILYFQQEDVQRYVTTPNLMFKKLRIGERRRGLLRPHRGVFITITTARVRLDGTLRQKKEYYYGVKIPRGLSRAEIFRRTGGDRRDIGQPLPWLAREAQRTASAWVPQEHLMQVPMHNAGATVVIGLESAQWFNAYMGPRMLRRTGDRRGGALNHHDRELHAEVARRYAEMFEREEAARVADDDGFFLLNQEEENLRSRVLDGPWLPIYGLGGTRFTRVGEAEAGGEDTRPCYFSGGYPNVITPAEFEECPPPLGLVIPDPIIWSEDEEPEV